MIWIGDFSKLSRVSIKTLRFYDEMRLLKPLRVDRFTGYCYDEFDQLPRLYRTLALPVWHSRIWVSHWKRSVVSSRVTCPPNRCAG